MWIYDYDSEGGYDYLGNAITDENGYFISDPIDNNDEEGGGQDVYVRFIADSSAVRVINSGIYDGFTDIEWNVPDGTTVDIGHWGPPTDEMPAWRAFDYMLDGWYYLRNSVSPQYNMPFQVAHWPSDSSYYDPGARIHLDDSASDCDVVVHEYGHAVMYRVYGDELPPAPNCNSHNINTVSSAGCAWAEGWANFFPLAVYDDEYFSDNAGGWEVNLETRNGQYHFEFGDEVEGNVAASLWDIFDEHDDGDYDIFRDGFNNIWDVVYYQNDDTFAEFYDAWDSRGHDVPNVNAICFQNEIYYNELPSCTVLFPSEEWYSETIAIPASASDPDGNIAEVEFQYRLGGFEDWCAIDSDTSPPDCSPDWCVDWTPPEYGEIWVRARAGDNLLRYSGWDASNIYFGFDSTDPEGWQNFNPTDWVADQTPDRTIEAKDITAGLDVSTACYKYSKDGGPTWSGWISASCTGSDGTTSYQTITASAVPFNQDSGTQNKIKYRIDDMVGNTGESGEYTVKIDAADPPAPAISSSTHPDEGEWYSGNDPSVTWTTPSDTSGIDCYSYIFDQSAITTPNTTCEPAGNSKSYTDVADGIWYFHLKAKDNAGNWGGADHYRVKIGSSEASTTDAAIALAIAAGSREYDSCWDVSGDGEVTALDALMILQAAGSEP